MTFAKLRIIFYFTNFFVKKIKKDEKKMLSPYIYYKGTKD